MFIVELITALATVVCIEFYLLTEYFFGGV